MTKPSCVTVAVPVAGKTWKALTSPDDRFSSVCQKVSFAVINFPSVVDTYSRPFSRSKSNGSELVDTENIPEYSGIPLAPCSSMAVIRILYVDFSGNPLKEMVFDVIPDCMMAIVFQDCNDASNNASPVISIVYVTVSPSTSIGSDSTHSTLTEPLWTEFVVGDMTTGVLGG